MKRYEIRWAEACDDPDCCPPGAGVEQIESPDGEWVRYEDHLERCKQLKMLIDCHEATLRSLTQLFSGKGDQ